MDAAASTPLESGSEEWLDAACPVVALLGLEHVHASLLSALPGGTSARPLSFVSRPLGRMAFPKKKAHARRVVGYANYEPAGIVPTKWLDKHRHQVPAVAVLLFEWETSSTSTSTSSSSSSSTSTSSSSSTSTEWQLDGVVSSVNAWRKENHTRDIPVLVVLLYNAVEDAGVAPTATLTSLGAADSSGATRAGKGRPPLSEKEMQALAKAAGLEVKDIFCLLTSRAHEALPRLEKLMYAAAQEHYVGLAKRVKKLKDKVQKHGATALQVRHPFKIGFFYEAAGDTSRALNYYKTAFDALFHHMRSLRVRGDRLAMLEVKSVAFMINFKIIALLIEARRYQDAVMQFELHIGRYRDAVGVKDLLFHHYAWLSRQYRTFGELAERCIEEDAEGANFLQRRDHNAGYYYQTAARFARQRKQAAASILALVFPPTDEPDSSVQQALAEGASYVAQPPEFVGQVGLSVEHDATSGSERISHIVRVLCYKEARVDHSALVINLLAVAYENFKMHKCTRMMLHVAQLMAHEYRGAGNLAMAKKFFDRIAKRYRKEKWLHLLASIVDNARQCAVALQMPADAVRYSLELLGAGLAAPLAKRKTIFDALVATVAAPQQAPPPPAADDPALGFGGSFLGQTFDVPVDHKLMLASVHFSTSSGRGLDFVHTDEQARLHLQLATFFPVDVRAARVVLTFNHGPDVFGAVVHDNDDPAPRQDVALVETASLAWEPNAVFDVEWTFDATKLVDISNVFCTGVYVYLQAAVPATPESSLLLRLHPLLPGDAQFRSHASSAPVQPPPPHGLLLEALDEQAGLDPRGVASVIAKPRPVEPTPFGDTLSALSVRPKLPDVAIDVRHEAPIVAGEFYRIVVTLAPADDDLSGALLRLTVDGAADAHPLYTQSDSTFEPLQDVIAIPDVASGATHETVLFIRVARPKQQITVNVALQLPHFASSPEAAVPELTHAVALVVSTPCATDFQVLPASPALLSSMNDSSLTGKEARAAIGRVSLGEVFVLRATICNTSGHALLLHRADVQLSDDTLQFADNYAPHELTAAGRDTRAAELNHSADLGGVLLRPTERYTSVYHLVARREGLILGGALSLEWSRARTAEPESNVTQQMVQFVQPLPAIHVLRVPYDVQVDFPPSCEFSRTFPLLVSVVNRTDEMVQLRVSAHEDYLQRRQGADDPKKSKNVSPFAISGILQQTTPLLPGASTTFAWTVAPKECGFVALPPLLVSVDPGGPTLFDGRSFGSVFVYPRQVSLKKRRQSTRSLIT